jgi:acetoin utilization deacetylase AcuC-like enzyme
MLLYHSSRFELHNTGGHPESVARITHLNAMLKKQGWLDECTLPGLVLADSSAIFSDQELNPSATGWQPATREQCTRNHSEKYIAMLQAWCEKDAGRVEVDTVVSNGSWTASTLAAGAVCDAVDRVVAGDDTTAFCAIRPPGHHALPDSAMGFCLLNNVSIAALHARSLGLNRVLIVDWDVHHGNGTQASFWSDPNVGFISIHRFPFYPGTGTAIETGTGDALGTKVNLPVPAAIDPNVFLHQLFDTTEALANKIKPELILLSAGFDAHRGDPVGGLTLEAEHFQEAGNWIRDLANQHCDGRLISVLEGGYSLKHMPECVDAHLKGMNQA